MIFLSPLDYTKKDGELVIISTNLAWTKKVILNISKDLQNTWYAPSYKAPYIFVYYRYYQYQCFFL